MITVNENSSWPEKVDVFGLQVSVTNYDDAASSVLQAAKRNENAVVSCHAAHAVVTFSGNEELREMANQFQMITPDGQPVRWAMNWLHKTKLKDRVYGPELMRRVCDQAADQGVPIFLYGGTDESLAALEENLKQNHQGINIAGSYSPPFRELSDEEVADVVSQIAESGAQIVFIGLGCPKQDIFAFKIRDSVSAVQICVGAAFDFHAGAKKMAPRWMQKTGTEWLYRLIQEPRRLWKRYLVTNSQFLWRLFKQTFSRKKRKA